MVVPSDRQNGERYGTEVPCDLDDLLDELMIGYVHEGHPEQRLALARRLIAAGISADDVRLLSEHVERTVRQPESRPAVLASILGDDREARLRLDDLAKIAALRASKAARKDAAMPLPHEVRWTGVRAPADATPEEAARWLQDDRAHYAWCRIHGDRATPETVARELGISEPALGALLSQAAELRVAKNPQPTPAIADDDGAAELDAALRTAKAYESAGRPIPGTVVDVCLRHRSLWKGRDVPASIVARGSP